MTNEDCIFCKIIKNNIPSIKIFENDKILAFLDIAPLNKGHTVVVPKEHNQNLLDFGDEKMKDFFIALKNIAQNLKERLNADGFNILQNNYKAAGQEVNHMHFHIVPRWNNDGLFSGLEKHKKQMELEELQKIQKLILSS